MKRLTALTLSLLLAAALFLVGGNTALAAVEDPFVGLWEMTGAQDGTDTISQADMPGRLYMDFLPSGAIYAAIDGEETDDDYFTYRVTGENTLELIEDGETLRGTYAPRTGVITLTNDEGTLFFLERVTDTPLPDIHALVDHSREAQIYYGYIMIQSGITIHMLETLPLLDMDPHDFNLTLRPDGSGFLQFGKEEPGVDLTWTDRAFYAGSETVPYTRTGDHIVFTIDSDPQTTVEFAPKGEVDALLGLTDDDGWATDLYSEYASDRTEVVYNGYVGDLPGTWSKDPVDIAGWLSYSYDLDETLYNAKSFQLTYRVVSSETIASGNCNVFIHIPSYGWKKIGSFALSRADVTNHTPVSQVFEFATPTTFDQVLVLPTFSMNFSSTLSLSEAWVFVD